MASPVGRILVAVDFSPSSGEALHFACSLAASLGASIDALHVMEPASGILRGAAQADTAEARSPGDQLRQFVSSVQKPEGLRVGERVIEGEVHDRIVSIAEQEGFDLIVMGTNGRTGRPAALVGSVAQSVVRLSPRPVLTVREGAATRS